MEAITVAAPAEAVPNPDAGGSYERNPATGELSPAERPAEQLPEQGGQTALSEA